MRILFALLKEIPVHDSDGYVLIEEASLPNLMPILLLHPENMNYLVRLAKDKSRQAHETVELISVDWEAIQESAFVSPSQAINMPLWYSIN